MVADPRWDPEMLAYQRANEAALAAAPPPDPSTDPIGARFLFTERAVPQAAGGPIMAETRDLDLPGAAGPLRCRLHRPTPDADLPVLVYAHGGGWVMGSPDTHDRLLRAYAAAAGCAVLAPFYPLAPENPFPRALDALAGLVRHLARGDAVPGLDTSRVVLGGDSAGANLALAAALHLRDGPPAAPLRGLLLNYGCFDAGCDTPSYGEFAEGYGLTSNAMKLFWRLYAPDKSDRAGPRASPSRAGLEGLPPTLLHVAELDVLRDDSARLADGLRAAGVPVESRVFPGTAHGFLRAQGQVGAAEVAVQEAASWLRGRFG